METDLTVEAMVNAADIDDDSDTDDAEVMEKKNKGDSLLPYIEQD